MKIMKITFISLCLIAIAMSNINAQPRPTRPTRPEPNTSESKPRQSLQEIREQSKIAERLLDDPYIFKQGEVSLSLDPSIKRDAYIELIAKSDEIIEQYQDEVDKFLSSNPDPSVFAKRLFRVKGRVKSLDSFFAQTEKAFKSGTSAGQVSYLQNLYLYKGFLQSVTKIYPNESVLQESLKQVSVAIESYGSREKFMEKMEANYKNMTKNMRMIPAGMSSPKIEAMVKNKYEAAFPGFKVTKVNITYNNWIIDKNDLGIPLMRKVSISVGGKNAKGECGIGSANVGEDYQGGGSYGQAYMYLPSDPIIVPCENIK